MSRRRGAKRMLAKQRDEAHRLLAEFGANCRFGRGAMVALVEEQVKRAVNNGQPRHKVFGIRNIEQPLRSCQYSLCPRDAFLSRRVATDKRARDLIYAEAA